MQNIMTQSTVKHTPKTKNDVDKKEQCTKRKKYAKIDRYIQVRSDHGTMNKKYDYTGFNKIH